MRISEIFTPGRLPTLTYVDDHLRDKAQQLHDALDDGSMLVSISGPSKSGKTVFVEHLLGKTNLIQVTGAGVQSPSDLWIKVFHIIGTPISSNISSSRAASGVAGATGALEGNLGVAKGTGAISLSGSYSSEKSESSDKAIDYLQLLIQELSNTDFVVFIDDFHYIQRDVQVGLAHQIKEAIRQGVRLICASVPYHSDDVLRSNPDLRGRIFSIDFDYWGHEVLQKIAYKGLAAANIRYREEEIKKLVDESAGSPQLMQYLCLNLCYEIGIRDVPRDQVELMLSQELFEKVCRRTALSTDYSSVVDKMIEGPKTRGSERKIHISKFGWQGDVYRFLVNALALDPPRLNFRYQPLVDRINSLCTGEAPSGSSITSACYHTATIANDTAQDKIVEWDSDNDVFDIRDPYLLFYLRWSEKLETPRSVAVG